MIHSKFNSEKGILKSKLVGVITLENWIDDIIEVGNDKNLPKKLLILTDATEAFFEFNESDIPDAIKIIERVVYKFEFIKEALVQNNPHVTALSMLYEIELAKFENFEYKIFSTFEAANRWLS